MIEFYRPSFISVSVLMEAQDFHLPMEFSRSITLLTRPLPGPITLPS